MGWLVPDIDRGAEAALAAAGPAEPRHEETPDSTFYVALRGILRLVPYVHWLVILAAFLATKLG